MSPTVARGGPSCQASCVTTSTLCLQVTFIGQLNVSSRLTMTDEYQCGTNSDHQVILTKLLSLLDLWVALCDIHTSLDRSEESGEKVEENMECGSGWCEVEVGKVLWCSGFGKRRALGERGGDTFTISEPRLGMGEGGFGTRAG